MVKVEFKEMVYVSEAMRNRREKKEVIQRRDNFKAKRVEDDGSRS